MTSKPLIYIYKNQQDDPNEGFNEITQKILEEYFELVTEPDLDVNPELASHIRGAIYSQFAARCILDRLPSMTSLQVVSAWSTGTDWVPVQMFKDMGITVAYCPAYKQQNKTVANYAVLLLLAVSRKFKEELKYYKQKGKDWTFCINRQGNDITNKTLGIVGMGRIGTALAKRAKAFDMQVVYHNRKKSTSAEAASVEYIADLDTLLPLCDFVAICCPLNESSRHMFQKRQFKLMKPTSILINISRGAVVNTEELVDALKTGEIGGAGLDVTDPEPLPEGHELFNLPNVITTFHCSAQTQEAKLEVTLMIRDNLKAVIIDGKPPPYEVKDD